MSSASKLLAATAAEHLADEVRVFNHATLDPSPFGDPAAVYRVLGDLVQMAHRLPQAFEQLARIIDVQRRSGECGIDEGTEFASAEWAMHDANEAVLECANRMPLIARYLERAQQSMSPVYTTRSVD